MANTIALIACAKNKADKATQARELYQSTLFRFNLHYAQKRETDATYILSAKHHLLGLEEVIEPYDKTLGDMLAKEVKAWSAEVAGQLREACNTEKTHFIILAGRRYRKYLLPYLDSYEIPMEEMGIGKQLQFLKRQIS